MSIRGFTFIELIIVVTIIAVLSIIAFPKWISLNHEASYASAKQVLNQFAASANQFRYKCIVSGFLGQSFTNGEPGNVEFENAIQDAVLLSRPSGIGNCYPEAQIDDGRLSDNQDCKYTFNALVDNNFSIQGINKLGSPHDISSDIGVQYVTFHQCRYYFLKGFSSVPDNEVPSMLYNAAQGTFTLSGFPS